jgi:hypothetical protein
VEQVTVLASSDAQGSVSPIKFSSCISTMARLLELSEKPLPRILVIHVSTEVAAHFGVDSPGIIRHNRSNTSDLLSYYELWIVSEPDPCMYGIAILEIFEDYFPIHFSPDERTRALASVECIWASDLSIPATVH